MPAVVVLTLSSKPSGSSPGHRAAVDSLVVALGMGSRGVQGLIVDRLRVACDKRLSIITTRPSPSRQTVAYAIASMALTRLLC